MKHDLFVKPWKETPDPMLEWYAKPSICLARQITDANLRTLSRNNVRIPGARNHLAGRKPTKMAREPWKVGLHVKDNRLGVEADPDSPPFG